MTRLQALARRTLHLVYPPQCLTCETLVEDDFSLCGPCYRETPFVAGHVCDRCGVPLPGAEQGGADLCDECLRIARPWARGRAALIYDGNARRMVLALKHGDRLDLARPAAKWMLAAARPLLQSDLLIAPVPLHWSRLARRRYNQAALLSGEMALQSGLAHLPDLLLRRRATASLGHEGRSARFAALEGAIVAHPRHAAALAGRHVLLVDDVMTSGATLAAASTACLQAGAADVAVVVLARVVKGAEIPIV